MMTTEYQTVSLPKPLIEEIKPVVARKDYGYTSISEFVKDACRRRLEALR